MSLLFGDVFEAIRYLRLLKGTTEKAIMGYIEERIGCSLTVGRMLKTVQALQKLVDDGILIKSGKRYAFARKPPPPISRKNKEEDDDDEEDENEEKKSVKRRKCCSKVKIDQNKGKGRKKKDEKEDENEEDDNEEDEDEDEEDKDDENEENEDCYDSSVDDDDECNDEDVLPNNCEKEGKETNSAERENEVVKVINHNVYLLNKGSNNVICPTQPIKKRSIVGFNKNCFVPQQNERKVPNGKNCKKKIKSKVPMDARRNADGKIKGYTNNDAQRNKKNTEYDTEVKKSKKYRSKMTKNRNHSQLKKLKANNHYTMDVESTVDIGFDSPTSQTSLKGAEGEMDFDEEKDDTDIELEKFDCGSRTDTTPPNSSDIHINRKKSQSSSSIKYPTSLDIKMDSLYDDEPLYSLVENTNGKQSISNISKTQSRTFSIEQKKESRKRQLSEENEADSTLLTSSLCSICEKREKFS